MAYKRILTIQDISCLGQCSATVALPVISACGHETCILPTALLSTHTGGLGKPAVVHLADFASDARTHWVQQGITFDAIYTGYLGSSAAVAAAEEAIHDLLAPGGILIVDPAMADHGRVYSGLDEDYVSAMTAFCGKADVLLPNMTEAAILTGKDYREEPDEAYAIALLEALPQKTVVLTGAASVPGETGVLIRTDRGRTHIRQERLPGTYHGTGDLFASCFTGALMQGKGADEAARIAAEVTWQCISNTAAEPAHRYGIKFETVLPMLMKRLNMM